MKIFFLLFISISLFAGKWCVYCGMPLNKDKISIKLKNGQIREYDSKACLMADIKKYGIKYKIDIDPKKIKLHKKYLQNIKEKKLYKMGKKIYQKRCKKIDKDDLDMYLDISDLQDDLQKKYCKNFSDFRVWCVGVFLWDKLHNSFVEENKEHIKVTKDEKCPVCGMFVYKYPRWAAQIFFKNNTHKSFDGVKCLMKYYFSHKKDDIKKILVTDYYKQYAIDAKKAYFVIKSDILGPMGEELIPFENIEEAKVFLKDHRGKKILRFDEISPKIIKELDE